MVDAVLTFLRTLFMNASTQVINGYDGLSLDIIIRGIIIYLLVIWAAFIIWVVKDISNRTKSLALQTVAVILIIVLTPIFGLPIYLLIRPRTTLFERYYTEGGEDISDGEVFVCHVCGEAIERDFIYCPHCRVQLVTECASCHKTIRTKWHVCPYCGKEPRKNEREKTEKHSIFSKKKGKEDSKPADEASTESSTPTVETRTIPEGTVTTKSPIPVSVPSEKPE